MTTIETAAAWRVGKPFTLAALAAIVSVGLAGCETSSTLFGSSGDATAPVAEAVQQPAVAQPAKFAVAAVIGPSEPVARQLETQVQAALVRQNITVAKSPTDKAEYTLRGYLVSAREKSGTKISHVWDVTDPTGKRVNRITSEELVAGAPGKDPWSAVTPQLVDQIANKTAGSLAAWLPTQPAVQPLPASSVPIAGSPGVPVTPVAAYPTGPAPVAAAPAPVTAPQVATGLPPAAAVGGGPTTTASITREAVMVPSVAGAPGDGSVSLTSAIQRELSKGGVALTDKPAGPTYKVEGKVVVGQGKDGKQPISIDWDVKDPKGKKLGTVSQKNEIPQGSVDGAWGKTADAAAAAAAQGIIKLLPTQTRTN
ncbi:MAG: hypothetical protein ACT4N2_08595 [Hyphomicrobium sp.]